VICDAYLNQKDTCRKREILMGQVHVQVLLTNHREAVLTRLGQLASERVHRVETEALIDTGAFRSVLPATIADQLGLLRLDRTEAKYANSSGEEVDVTEAFTVEILGRRMVTSAMVLGERVLLGVTVLEELDLMVDAARQRLIPNEGTWDRPMFRV
jgi:clan AA aspartic protease